jgi:phage tail-like protein
MTIYDCWLNPLDTGIPPVTVLGYREDLEEFPHELYSFFLSSVRDMDIKNVRLLWRWLQGMQQQFESTYGKILNLPLLYSPDYCPEEYLDYLAMNVGITSPDMDYLWGELTTIEKRRLISIFVQSIMLRGTDSGIELLISSMTGQYTEIREYFDYRWLISGDGELNQETALGYEDDLSVAGDPWLLSENSMPIGYLPDDILIITAGSNIYYGFKVDSLIEDAEPPIPPNPPFVRITYRPTKESVLGIARYSPAAYVGWYVFAPVNYDFGQTVTPYSELLSDFRVAFNNDAYIFDIRVMDNGTVNRDMVTALARFSRPISERIYIRYLNLIEHFDDDVLGNWTEVEGTVNFDTDANTVTLSDASSLSTIRTDVDGDASWTDYSFGARVNMEISNVSLYLRSMWQDDQNYIELRIVPNADGHALIANWNLYQVVSGTPTVLDSGTLEQCDIGVYYYYRIVAFASNGNLIVRAYHDENLLCESIDTLPWTTLEGKVEISVFNGGSAVVKDVEVHPYPMDEYYVGP